MRCTVYIILVLLLLSCSCFAQSPEQLKQINSLEAACKKYAYNEQYDSLIYNAQLGYNLASSIKKNESASLFAYYLGAGYTVQRDLDKAIYYYRVSEATGYLIHSSKRFINAQVGLADDYYSSGKPDSVLMYQKKMLIETGTLRDSVLLVKLYNELAIIYTNSNDYEKGITAYMQVMHYYKQHNDTNDIAVALVNIGNIYLQMSNSNKALPYFLQAIPLLANYEYGQIICKNNTAEAYCNLKMYDSAIAYDEDAIRISKKIKDSGCLYGSYEILAGAFIGQKQYNKAEQYLKPALQYGLAAGITTLIADTEEFLGEVEAGRKNYIQALNYFSKAITYSKKSNYAERVSKLYQELAEAADSAHLYQSAAGYYQQHILLNDSLIKESSKKTIAELETQYQTQQKEQQIKLLNQQSKTQTLALKNQQNKTWFLLAGFLFAAILIALFIRYRYRLNQLKKLTEVRNSISRDLHDEIGATLSSINIYSEVAKNKLENNKEVELLLQRIHDGSAQMMDGMSDIVWYVNPKNDNAGNTIIKMREYAAPVLEAKQVNLNFTTDEHIKNVKLNMLQRQNFYLLFKEAINNIAKYAGACNTYVDIKMIGNHAYFKIKDDGKGFNLNNHKNGNGLNNIQQRTKFLKGNCIIKTEPGNGTCIEVNFPASL